MLKVGDVQVDPSYIRYVVISGTGSVNFQLLALEEEGKRLERELRRFEAAGGVECSAQDDRGEPVNGLYEVKVISVEKDSTKIPVRYRIRGSLQQLT